MQARPYRPDICRFLTHERFESASGDLALQTDPLTNNRYVFAAANPVNNIEFDGHYGTTSDHRSRNIQTKGGNTFDREHGGTIAGPAAGSGPGGSGYSAPPDPPEQSGAAPLTDVSSTGQQPYTDKRLAAPRSPNQGSPAHGQRRAPYPGSC
jgi:hypothetical protein